MLSFGPKSLEDAWRVSVESTVMLGPDLKIDAKPLAGPDGAAGRGRTAAGRQG